MKGLLLLGGLAVAGVVLMQRAGVGLTYEVEPWGPEQEGVTPEIQSEEDWLSGDRYIQAPHRLLEPYLEHLR